MRILLGDRLRGLREDRDLKQKELAQELNCSQKMISNYECNQREPDLCMLRILCDFFNVTADYILGRSESPSGEAVRFGSDEEKLLKFYRRLPEEFKKDVLRFARLNFEDYNRRKFN